MSQRASDLGIQEMTITLPPDPVFPLAVAEETQPN
jgi:hypothetical protein